MFRSLLAASLLVALAVGASLGCDDDPNSADSELERKAETAGQELKEAGQAVGETLEEAGEKAVDAAKRGEQKLGEAMESAGEGLQKDADPPQDPDA